MLPLIMLATLLAGAGLWAWAAQRRNRLRARLGFGFQAPEPEEVEDLSAGDYGLTGRERFYYHLQKFFETAQGRLLLFSSGAGAMAAFGLLTGMQLQQVGTTSLAGGLATLLIAMTLLAMRRNRRARLIVKELPSTLEMLSALMEGGLAFEASLSHILREADRTHPLYFDLEVMSEAMRRGRRRNEALRLWAQRCNLAQVADITSGLIQAEQTSAALGPVLRHHAQAMLRENEGEVQRRAERLPIRMLLPMVLTIFPAVLIVAALPSFLKIFRVMEEIMRGAGRIAGG